MVTKFKKLKMRIRLFLSIFKKRREKGNPWIY